MKTNQLYQSVNITNHQNETPLVQGNVTASSNELSVELAQRLASSLEGYSVKSLSLKTITNN